MASKIKDLPYIPVTAFATIVTYELPAGTNAGAITKSVTETRPLNTVRGDTQFISVSSNQMTIQPGSYVVLATSEKRQSAVTTLSIYNVTDSVVEIIGDSGYANSTTNVSIKLNGILTVTSPKIYELQIYSSSGTGLSGVASNVGISEVYEMITFIRI